MPNSEPVIDEDYQRSTERPEGNPAAGSVQRKPRRRPDIQIYRPPRAKDEAAKGAGDGTGTVPNSRRGQEQNTLGSPGRSRQTNKEEQADLNIAKRARDRDDTISAATSSVRGDAKSEFNTGHAAAAGMPRRPSLPPKSASFEGQPTRIFYGSKSRSSTEEELPVQSKRYHDRRPGSKPGTRENTPQSKETTPQLATGDQFRNGRSEPSRDRQKRSKEFKRTGSEIPMVPHEEWRNTVKEFFRKPASELGTAHVREKTSEAPKATRPVSYVDPSSRSGPIIEEKNTAPNSAPAITSPLSSQLNEDLNRSWIDIMDEEDRTRPQRESGDGAPSCTAERAPSGVPGAAAPAKRSVGRGGLIQMTPEMASALSKNERRGGFGRGNNLRRSLPSQGRSRGGVMSAGNFPRGRHVDEPSASIRLNPRFLPDVVPMLPVRAVIGRGRPISGISLASESGERPGVSDGLLQPEMLREMDHLENKVAHYARIISRSNGRNVQDEVEKMLEIRKDLQEVFHGAVHKNPRHEDQRTLESRMWKSAFYQPVEALRQLLHSGMEFYKEHLLALIEEGTTFYELLISEYERNNGFKVEEFCYRVDDKLVNILYPAPMLQCSTVKYALACCQRCLVALGDLARYREQVKGTSRFGTAKTFYSQAAQLAPMNGRVHNQLALLAMYNNRWLDAVFNYARSLAAKHAFELARDALIDVFEDIRIKVDSYENSRLIELEQLRRKHGARDGRNASRRLNQREIWRFPDGTTSNLKAEEKLDTDETALLTKFSAQELFKRCCAYLLRAAGILFTRIGVDCFETIAESALIQFRALLNLDESPLSPSHVVQLTVILLFLVHHTSAGETERGSIKTVQNYAILLSFSVFGLLLERLEHFLHGDDALDSFEKRVHRLLPAIRIFCVWMSAQDAFNLYSDLQSAGGGLETEKFSVSLWKNLADVCALIERHKRNGKLKVSDSRQNSDSIDVVLPEDLFTTAFFDIFASKPTQCKIPKDMDPAIAAEHVRINWLHELASVLDGYEFEAFTISDGQYRVPERSDSPRPGQLRTAASDEEDVASEVAGARSSASEMESVGEMSQLQRLQRDNEMKKSALEREGQCRSEVIVEPYHLVVDTNSFIEHCGLIERVVRSKQYKLAVPLVVYNELLGLEKNEESWVSGQAKSSLDMLRDFTHPSSPYGKHIEAMTSSGAILADFEYHKNEDAQRQSNDDLVLKCCRCLAQLKEDELGKKQERKNLRSEPLTIYRKVVLVTDDKNLRLKAQGEEIPVVGIKDFVMMARLGPQ